MTFSFDLTISSVLYRTDPREVQSMIAQVATIPLRTHLYLIDNSPDCAPSRQTEGDVTRIFTGANLGYGRAHNIAIRDARGRAPYHLIANTDIVFAGADILYLLEVLQSSPDIGMVAPRVRYPDGEIQHLCRLFPEPSDLVAKRLFGNTGWGRRRHRRYELCDWDYASQQDIPFLSGCFMLARHDVLAAVDGFDERYFLYFEDLDLSRRINARYRTVFTPRMEITHLYRSKLNHTRTLLRYLMVSGARYFFKWGWLFDRDRDRINRQTLDRLRLEP